MLTGKNIQFNRNLTSKYYFSEEKLILFTMIGYFNIFIYPDHGINYNLYQHY